MSTGGVVLTLPHTANWDWAGAWAAQYFGSLCTVAERLRPEGVFQKFLAMRSAVGITIMPLTGEGGTYEYLRDHVNQGRLVALLGDRDVAKNGMGVEFFGHRASLPIGAALLALDTGRPLFTCAPWYDGQTLVIEFDKEIEFDRSPVQGRERLRRAQEITKLIATNFEKHISAHPGNWHQLQPVWSDLTTKLAKQ
jgi:KDO2-lipid IV(A) lauroyltransferase